MNKSLKFIVLLLSSVILFHSISFGQNTSEEITNRYFELYANNPKAAVDYIFSTNKYVTKKAEIAKMGNELKDLGSSLGTYYGFELLSERYAGKNYKLVTFIVRYEQAPMRFNFILYRPNDVWQLNSFSFDQKIDEDLDQASKLGFYFTGMNAK
jgi:hypothetical protein